MQETIIAILVPVGLYLVLGILNALVAKSSQIDAWAEANPRIAALLKMMRALGLDPWMAIQSLTLLVKGRLPLAIKAPAPSETKKPPLPPLPPIALVMLSAALGTTVSGCASWQEPARTVNSAAETICSIFFAKRQGISVEDAAKLLCSTREQLDPFIDEVLAAQHRAGTMAAQRTGLPAGKAPKK